ncbi:alpha-1,3-fucosyl transferase [Helicobacter sp. MIT 00-7814]|uniref:glycosyltransferase family 10 domain-containing protein n=1 Tax=unclassified Helicobacter TaxID=2593540 RepID=UPI000E1FA52E|nr:MULTISPECIES: glycosyltransferase family 10 [unclassified Helicobacter]RDU53050.1 alpha-1,3-fucosyl transferase [Helicobacter sp. MIT 99-10781]RDU55307.1 alpha-1,3-fucosyl transferase [Helicobacter sp. MIT 00-7814]
MKIENKERVRIHFTDGCAQHWFEAYLPKGYVLDSKNPDFIFYSVFGNEHIKYDGVRIFYTAENLRADFNFCDYAISFDYLNFEDRHLRYPYYLFTQSFREVAKSEQNGIYSYGKEACERKFCSFVVSNGKADSIREDFFELLSAYKRVDSGGKYKNNIGARVGDKQAFLSQYKFNIAFENSQTNGYLTEKIFDAKAAGTLPIYWGDISASHEHLGGGAILNAKAFVNISDFANLKEAVEFIKYLDSNDEVYLTMLNAPLLINPTHAQELDSKLTQFLGTIFSQGRERAYRRGFGQWRCNIEMRYKKFQRARTTIINLTKALRFILKVPVLLLKSPILAFKALRESKK